MQNSAFLWTSAQLRPRPWKVCCTWSCPQQLGPVLTCLCLQAAAPNHAHLVTNGPWIFMSVPVQHVMLVQVLLRSWWITTIIATKNLVCEFVQTPARPKVAQSIHHSFVWTGWLFLSYDLNWSDISFLEGMWTYLVNNHYSLPFHGLSSLASHRSDLLRSVNTHPWRLICFA